jgi:hypothetical protein
MGSSDWEDFVMAANMHAVARAQRRAEWIRESVLPMIGRVIACAAGVGIGYLIATI